MKNLKAKLKSLGADLKTDAPKDNLVTDSQSDSHVDTPFGKIRCKKTFHDTTLKFNSENTKGIKSVGDYCRIPEIKTANPYNFVFVDLETTGLSGGAGTIPFLTGAGVFRNGKFELHQYFLESPSQEKAGLHLIKELIKDKSVVVSFNGKSFDIPLLKSRFVLHFREHPFDEKYNLDLLHIFRRLFRNRFENCSLQYLEYRILRLFRTSADIEGYMIPEMYTQYLHDRDEEFVESVMYHNEVDITSMVSLLDFLVKYLSEPCCTDYNDITDPLAVCRFFEFIEDSEYAEQMYRFYEKHPGCTDNDKFQWHYSIMLKKSKRFEKAVEIWERMSENNIDACLELAKHYEHKIRDFDRAMQYTYTAFDLALSQGKSLSLLKAIQTRMKRLEQKIKKDCGNV